jgi:hypothetical protein
MENLEQLRKELHQLIDDKIDDLNHKEEKINLYYTLLSSNDKCLLDTSNKHTITKNQLERIKAILNEK